MNLFEDFQFFVYLAVAAVPAIILGIKEKQIKYYAFAVSLIFIWLALGGNIRAMVSLTGYCFFEFAVLQTWLRIVEKRGRVGGLYVLYIILGIAPLAVCKISGTLHITTIGFIGISYMTFKVVQMIIEIYDGLIKKVPIFDYFSFLLFFPAVLSGPIDRSRRYSEDIESIPSKSEYENMLGNGLMKLVMGIVYKFVIAASIYQAILWLGMKHTMQSAFIYMYSYGFYLFFDFAGYSLMAIGCGYIFGIRLPENFKLPFISKDISDFWNRWHITLSHWFRDYLFSRMMMRWIRGKRFNSRLTAACCGFMVNMTVMGIWHGFTVYYIMYGVYHGTLLALTEIWQKKSPVHKKYKKKKWYTAVTTVVTFNLIMFGLFIFSGRFTALAGI